MSSDFTKQLHDYRHVSRRDPEMLQLRSYSELLFIQYAILNQLEDSGLFNLCHPLSSRAVPLGSVMTFGLKSVHQQSPQTRVRPLRASMFYAKQ